MSEKSDHSVESADWSIQFTEVDVPVVEYSKFSWRKAIVQGVKRLLLPTTSDAFLKKQEYFLEKFNAQVLTYSADRNSLKSLYLASRAHRISLLRDVTDKLRGECPPKQWNEEMDHVATVIGMHMVKSTTTPPRKYSVIDPMPSDESMVRIVQKMGDPYISSVLDQYCNTISRTQALRAHLEEVDQDLTQYAYLVKTQATAELTYFRGLKDWAEGMLQLSDSLMTALITISTLGAGLVYSTVFGATRGNVGLMTYTFPFFSLGFLIPVVVQIVLRWAAGLQKEVKFASQQFWTIVIGLAMSLSSIAVMAALTLLNFTIFFLRANPDDPTPGAKTEVPGIIAFGISGSVFVLIFAAFMLSAIATRAFMTMKGIRRVVSAMYGNGSHREDDFKYYLPV